MNKVTDSPLLDPDTVRREILARDREMDNDYTKDLQVAALRQARSYLPDKITRVASPHKLTDPKAGPMIAVRLNILTRKTLGGLNTDLDSRVLGARRQSDPRAVRSRRGRRVRRRRRARLPLAGGDVPRRLHLQRSRGRTGGARSAVELGEIDRRRAWRTRRCSRRSRGSPGRIARAGEQRQSRRGG